MDINFVYAHSGSSNAALYAIAGVAAALLVLGAAGGMYYKNSMGYEAQKSCSLSCIILLAGPESAHPGSLSCFLVYMGSSVCLFFWFLQGRSFGRSSR